MKTRSRRGIRNLRASVSLWLKMEFVCASIVEAAFRRLVYATGTSRLRIHIGYWSKIKYSKEFEHAGKTE